MKFKLLDYRTIDGKTVLLDGKGQPLPEGAEPIWLEFTFDECLIGATNSCGEKFHPGPIYNTDGDTPTLLG